MMIDLGFLQSDVVWKTTREPCHLEVSFFLKMDHIGSV